MRPINPEAWANVRFGVHSGLKSDLAQGLKTAHERKSPLCSITSSPRATTWLRWSFGQPGLPQSFFVSREVFGMPIRAQHVFESGNA